MKQFWIMVFVWMLLLSMDACACFAEDVNNGQDITRPLTRFDVRYQNCGS